MDSFEDVTIIYYNSEDSQMSKCENCCENLAQAIHILTYMIMLP